MTDSPLYEDELDAMRDAVKHLGGAKKVGEMLWPDKATEAAARHLLDCLNPNRAERLSPSQLLLLMRKSCPLGFHGLTAYFLHEAGYGAPAPLDAGSEAAVLTLQLASIFSDVSCLTHRLERILLPQKAVPNGSELFGTVRNGLRGSVVRWPALTDSLLYEDELDAVRDAVKHLGGAKKVGEVLWPDKATEAAARHLLDCLNPNRAERLSPSQLLLLMRKSCAVGFHGLAAYFLHEAGYAAPAPLDPENEAAVLTRQLASIVSDVSRLTHRLERIRGMEGV